MAALCEMKLNLQLAKREGTWLLWSPEAEIPLAYSWGGGGRGRRESWCATTR